MCFIVCFSGSTVQAWKCDISVRYFCISMFIPINPVELFSLCFSPLLFPSLSPPPSFIHKLLGPSSVSFRWETIWIRILFLSENNGSSVFGFLFSLFCCQHHGQTGRCRLPTDLGTFWPGRYEDVMALMSIWESVLSVYSA